ncbi:aldo/keto reductase [Vulcanisaeta thermophila]|uniref:aldo/keto reductase n=1 Tax=Vulcanisaeta thermophila TaxID=867917 RepID=UPI0008536B0E|nr:aldo/keto reductase [Vulcanisaeta thermophila]
MNYRELGGTGIRVSEVGFGAWTIGSGMYGNVSVEEGIKMIRRALDLGINVFDTADVYGNGESERLLGRVLRGYDVYIFTKVGYDIYSGTHGQNFRPDYIEYAVRKSLERLGLRRLTLLQLHNPPLRVIRDKEVRSVMRRLVEEGLVEHVGVALGPETNVLNEGLAALEEGYETIMFVFNALEQEPGRTLISEGLRFNAGLMTRVPHASTALNERFMVEFPKTDHRSLRSKEWLMRTREFVEKRLRPIARGLGLTLDAFAIKYVLSYPISTVFITATDTNELETYVRAADGNYLDQETLRKLEELYGEFQSLVSEP